MIRLLEKLGAVYERESHFFDHANCLILWLRKESRSVNKDSNDSNDMSFPWWCVRHLQSLTRFADRLGYNLKFILVKKDDD